MKKIVLCLLLIFILTACSNDTNVITTEYDNLYQINDQNVVYHVNDERITKLEASEITFYIYEPNINERLFYSSILSSIYYKHKKEIKNIAKKYELTVTFKHSTDDYLDKKYFKEYFMTIDATNKDTSIIDKFVNEIMEMSEIKKLYQVWLSNQDTYYVYDFSSIIDSSEKGLSLFEYYKNSNQEKKQDKEEIKSEENIQEDKKNSSQED